MTESTNWNENEQILHSLKDDILVTNLDGIILKVSEFTGKIYEVESDSLIGKSVYDLEAQGLFTPILTPIVLKEKKKLRLFKRRIKEKTIGYRHTGLQ
ncbi:PAS domain-containing protein [Bacillus sp. OVS6]|nr:PAS domain-containing protein [Bacillus sp. OVS6]